MRRKVSVRIEVHVAGSKLAGFRYKPEQLLAPYGGFNLQVILDEVIPVLRAAAEYARNENTGLGVRG